jgi:hypothetical protein
VFRTQPDRWNDPRWRCIIRTASFLLLCAPALLLESKGYSARSAHAAAWPDPLVLQNGAAVHNRDDFEQLTRPEIFRLFEENVYGRTPSTTLPVRILQIEVDAHALQGLARRTQITLAVRPTGERIWHLLQYLPLNHAAAIRRG